MIGGTDGSPQVAAGRAVVTFVIAFDADGNPIVIDISQTATPKMEHTTKLLCA